MRDLTIKFVWLSMLVLLVCIGIIWGRPMALLFIQETQSRFQQHSFHERTYENVICPTANRVRTFHTNHLRLPTQGELDQNSSNHSSVVVVLIYTNSFHGERSWGRRGIDFMLCVPIGDWSLYYRSWDGKEFKFWTD